MGWRLRVYIFERERIPGLRIPNKKLKKTSEYSMCIRIKLLTHGHEGAPPSNSALVSRKVIDSCCGLSMTCASKTCGRQSCPIVLMPLCNNMRSLSRPCHQIWSQNVVPAGGYVDCRGSICNQSCSPHLAQARANYRNVKALLLTGTYLHCGKLQLKSGPLKSPKHSA